MINQTSLQNGTNSAKSAMSIFNDLNTIKEGKTGGQRIQGMANLIGNIMSIIG